MTECTVVHIEGNQVLLLDDTSPTPHLLELPRDVIGDHTASLGKRLKLQIVDEEKDWRGEYTNLMLRVYEKASKAQELFKQLSQVQPSLYSLKSDDQDISYTAELHWQPISAYIIPPACLYSITMMCNGERMRIGQAADGAILTSKGITPGETKIVLDGLSPGIIYTFSLIVRGNCGAVETRRKRVVIPQESLIGQAIKCTKGDLIPLIGSLGMRLMNANASDVSYYYTLEPEENPIERSRESNSIERSNEENPIERFREESSIEVSEEWLYAIKRGQYDSSGKDIADPVSDNQ